METSINLDLDDLMGPEDDFDDDLPAVTRLPGLHDDDDQENLLNTSGQRNEGLLDTLLDPAGGEEGAAPAAKRIVNRKPIPKLDATRLTGERGLPVLMKHFEKVKFKGKGHEASDLDRLMRVMEHWAHRLFPKMPFDDVIERIEKLGSKKAVQTCIRKIRLDMPLLDEDFVTRGGEDVIEGDTQPPADLGDDFPAPSFPGTQQTPSSIPKVPMTDEQRERIELNKRLAMERRLNKQKAAPSSQSDGLNESEINDLFGTEPTKSRMDNDDEIDSDEAEMEREMWASQVTGEKKKDDKKASQQRADPEEVEIDPDEEEMENEMWNQMTQPVPSQSQMDRSQEMPSGIKKTKGVVDESDEGTGNSQEGASKGARKSKRVIDDDSDDGDEVMKDSKMERSSEMPSRVAKKRRVIEDDESEEEMEDSNKMTELLSPKTHLQKRIGDDDDDDDDDNDGGDSIEDTKVDRVDICNQMTEPVVSQRPTDSTLLVTSQEASDDSAVDQVLNNAAGETGSEIWNQMTEQVATQNVNDSQEDEQSYTELKNKKSALNDEDDEDSEIDPDVCNQDTEPVLTRNSQDTA